jgi:hypothetical protein
MLQSRYRWDPRHDGVIRRNFDRKAAHCLSDAFVDVREKLSAEIAKGNNDYRPTWIPAAAWSTLREYFESAEFQKKREINRKNKSSANSSKHCLGSQTLHSREAKLVNLFMLFRFLKLSKSKYVDIIYYVLLM